MQKWFISILTVAMMYSPSLFAQGGDQAQRDVIKNIFYEIKAMKQYGYKYVLAAKFPDGSEDQVKGEMFLNTDSKILLNDCTKMTMLLTNSWYYSADHAQKLINIVNLSKDKRHKTREQAQDVAFGNGEYLNSYVDSAILVFGIIKGFKKAGDSITCHLVFPPKIMIRSIDLVYDQKAKIPLSYVVKTYYAWTRDKKYAGKGTTKVLRCFDYKKTVDVSKYDVKKYFVISNGQAILKKYKKYTVKTEL